VEVIIVVRGNEMRDQCQRERDDQAQRIVDLEMGLAEQARLLGEERRAREAAEARHELKIANLGHWMRERHKETAHVGLRGFVHRLTGRGV
jgi:hypothetical protein